MSLRPRHRAGRRIMALGHQLALIALVAQFSLPWVQGWHEARERPAIDAQMAAPSGATHACARPAAQPRHDQHDRDACPVCRSIGQSRSALVVTTLRVTAVPLVHSAAGAMRDVALETFSDNTAAPRAPPLFLI